MLLMAVRSRVFPPEKGMWMKIHSLLVLAGAAVGLAVLSPAAAAYAIDASAPGVTVAAAAFVDNCDRTVDVLTMNVTRRQVTLRVTGTPKFALGAGKARLVAHVAPVETPMGLVVRVSSVEDLQLQEVTGAGGKKVGGPAFTITHYWQGCADASTPTEAPTAVPSESGSPSAAPSGVPTGVPSASAAPSVPSDVPVVLPSPSQTRIEPAAASLPVTGSSAIYWIAAVGLLAVGMVAVLIARSGRRFKA